MLICKQDFQRLSELASRRLRKIRQGVAALLLPALVLVVLLASGLAATTSVALAQDSDAEQQAPSDADSPSEDELPDEDEQPPAELPKSSDPSAIWPDPINESQLGSEAVYYHYARSDGHSLLRTATPRQPLRIWVGGDSMAGGASYGLDFLFGGNQDYEVTSEIRKSTGTVSTWYFDWPDYMSEVVAESGYDVIVLSMGANDNQKFSSESADVGEPAWLEIYQARVDALLNAATRPGRLVVLVGLPHMEPRWLRPFPDLVNPIFERAVAKIPDAFYVDAAAILSPDGKYVRRLGGVHGNRTVRTADGVHYTFYGGELVSEPIVAEIERRAGLAELTE